MKIIAKGKINLTPRAPKQKKEQDKYSEIPNKTKREYLHEINDQVIYLGIIDIYKNTLATIIKRSKKHISEYYSIKFAIDDEIVNDIAGGVLISLEEYELKLAKEEDNEESNQEDDIDLSDEEIKVIQEGYSPYKNRLSCFSPIDFLKKNCLNECTHRHQCIYRFKGKYDKIKF